MSEYEALIARLASADATITTLDAENADLHGEVRTLREQIEAQGETLARTLADHEAEVAALRWSVRESEGRRDTAEMRVAELTRQRDDARDLAVRCGAFHNSVGADYHAHLDGTWPMELVDPEGRLFK